ncbi:MAG: hypothetical protein WA948_11290 [Pontixanthobacter sp.]
MKKSHEAALQHKLMRYSSSFFIWLAIAIFFGYSVGKDMALRDNARDATAVIDHDKLPAA